ncbi:MAG: AEC family transporter [Mogibacterium sp.]|nr:AEC family transporter [Mogibacterium sp.]
MLSNFLICLNAVIPLTLYLVIGYAVRRFGLLSGPEVRRVNHMIFIVFFPPMMFENIYGADIGQVLDWKLIGFGIGFILFEYFLITLFVRRVEKDPKSRGAMIQAIYRSNFVLMGLPIAMNIFGKGNVSVTAMMIMFVVPLFNVLAVFTLEYYRGGRANYLDMVKKICQNPIILGAIAGILALVLHIQVPAPLLKVIGGMADATTPMALILLGASFNIQSVQRDRRNLSICLIGRLIVIPAIGLTLAVLLGIRGVGFVTLIAMLAAPTAVSSFTMAESMDSNGELAGNAVIFSTPISCVTLFLWLFLFKSLGMF